MKSNTFRSLGGNGILTQPENQSNAVLSVIIVNWNTKDLLRNCVSAVFEQTKGISFEVIVVDNASSDGSPNMVERQFPQVKLIRNKKNFGFAKANNQAIKIAIGRYILLLNSDTEVIGNSLKNLVEFMDSHPDAAVAGGKLSNKDGTIQGYCRKFSTLSNHFFSSVPLLSRLRPRQFRTDLLPVDFNYDQAGEVDYVWGAFFCMRREVIEDIGLLDERFFMYSEEEDWCYRAKKNGWKVYYTPSAQVIHYHGMSTKKINNKMLKQIYKSKYLFFEKHYGKYRAQIFRFNTTFSSIISITVWSVAFIVLPQKRSKAIIRIKEGLNILNLFLHTEEIKKIYNYEPNEYNK